MRNLELTQEDYDEAYWNLTNDLKDYQKRLSLWEKVTVKTKKNGDPFKDLVKNFTNCYPEKHQFEKKWSKLVVSDNTCGDSVYIDDMTSVNEVMEKIEEQKKFIRSRIAKDQYELNHFDDLFAEAKEETARVSEWLELHSVWHEMTSEWLKIYSNNPYEYSYILSHMDKKLNDFIKSEWRIY